jgi:hypothetical protein
MPSSFVETCIQGNTNSLPKESPTATFFDRDLMNEEEKILFGHEIEAVTDLDYILTI